MACILQVFSCYLVKTTRFVYCQWLNSMTHFIRSNDHAITIIIRLVTSTTWYSALNSKTQIDSSKIFPPQLSNILSPEILSMLNGKCILLLLITFTSFQNSYKSSCWNWWAISATKWLYIDTFYTPLLSGAESESSLSSRFTRRKNLTWQVCS